MKRMKKMVQCNLKCKEQLPLTCSMLLSNFTTQSTLNPITTSTKREWLPRWTHQGRSQLIRLRRFCSNIVQERLILLVIMLSWLNRLKARERWTRWFPSDFNLFHQEEIWALCIKPSNTTTMNRQTTKIIYHRNPRVISTAPWWLQGRAHPDSHQQMLTWIK